MSLTLKVNAAEFGKDNFDLLPDGDYELALVNVKVEPFAKQGNYTDITKYSLTWKVTENNEVGVGRRIFDNVAIIENWRNEAKSANFKFSQLCKILGVEPDEDGTLDLPDADEILDSEWVTGASVKTAEDKTGKYDDRNEISSYLSEERFAKSKKRAVAPEKTSTGGTGGKSNGLFV